MLTIYSCRKKDPISLAPYKGLKSGAGSEMCLHASWSLTAQHCEAYNAQDYSILLLGPAGSTGKRKSIPILVVRGSA